MSVTVGANFLSVLHAGSNGITIAFPDVCKTPMPAGVAPLPYPTLAKTANAVQQKKKTSGGRLIGVSSYNSIGPGSVVTTPTPQAASARQTEIQQLKALMSQTNAKLLGLTTNDPNQWQAVIQEYIVASSALYLTIHSE